MRSRGHRIHAAGKALIFETIGAARYADIEPAVRDDVGHRRFAGELHGMPEGCDDRAGAETHSLGASRQVGNIDERIGGDGEIHAMMLARPDRMQAA
jgi:hypothetical protein